MIDELFRNPVELVGFGSLLSEASARSTFPELINFRVGKLSGFRRVFGHAAPILFERSIGKPSATLKSGVHIAALDSAILDLAVR